MPVGTNHVSLSVDHEPDAVDVLNVNISLVADDVGIMTNSTSRFMIAISLYLTVHRNTIPSHNRFLNGHCDGCSVSLQARRLSAATCPILQTLEQQSGSLMADFLGLSNVRSGAADQGAQERSSQPRRRD